jgi:erythromycin esterase
MIIKNLVLLGLTCLIIYSCSEDLEKIESTSQSSDVFTDILEMELNPLSSDPLNWSDIELSFLDPIANKSIVALGEATHGTAEFFNAKHRMFKYLVENHGFKILAFEADFGESLFINDAIQRGAADEIEDLMRSKMHYWTLKTEEVKNLLEWMCNYNIDKPDEDKVQYFGIDCFFNTFHPGLLKDYFRETEVPFLSNAEILLDEAEEASKAGFDTYSEAAFELYLDQISGLRDTMIRYKNSIVELSSEKDYELHLRILEVVRQVSEVNFYSGDEAFNYRDRYMAENTTWIYNYFNKSKVVTWAHNFHVSNVPDSGTMGYQLTDEFANDYTSIGFLFSQGSFTAVGLEGGQSTGLGTQTITVTPKTASLNYMFSLSKEPVFSVKISDLGNSSEWNNVFANSLQYFQIGALYNNMPETNYSVFDPTFLDYMIYFDKTTASTLLE